MASALFIKPMVFNQLSEEQILTWRKETYSRLKEYITYSPNDMLSIKPTKITTLESMSISMKNKLISFRTTNELKFSKSIFIMIDSCILGKKTIPTIISDLKQKWNLYQTNIIIIFSHISITENYYKLYNKDKYPDINFKCLNFNLDLLEKKIPFKMANISILKTDISFDNKMLFKEEKQFLQLNKSWNGKDRNEINDNAQLEILIHMNKIFSKDCFMITRDRDLIQKTKKKSEMCKGLYVYDHF